MPLTERVRRWRDESGDVQPLGLVRLVVGYFLFRQALHDLQHAGAIGYFGDQFHIPMLPEALVPSARGFLALELLMMLLGAAAVVGVAARPALLVAAPLGIYLLACDRMRYHHHLYTLYLTAFLLAFTPCDRSWTRGRRLADERQGPLWAVRLLQLQLSIIYLSSGGSKLFDRDWRSGRVLADRIARWTSASVDAGVPRKLLALLSSPVGGSLLAKGAIATELGVAIALWIPRTRRLAAAIGIAFHITIDFTAGVDIFSWLSIAILLLFWIYPTPSE
ncbi:MAG: hypothetical protein JWN44_1077 [Myxococcales bacterium]|nr:hypothetical protein [Myxococcales bacterium]